MRALIWFAGSVLTIGFALWLIAQYDYYQKFKRELTEFRGIKLGASRMEVNYVLGYPNQVISDIEIKGMPGHHRVYDVDATEGPNVVPNGKTINDFHTWSWNLSNEELSVTFDSKNETITSIICYTDENFRMYPNCSGFGSITAGDSEDLVVDKLGQPDRVEFLENSTTKILIYNSIGFEIYLSRREVYRWTKRMPLDLDMWWWLRHGRPS